MSDAAAVTIRLAARADRVALAKLAALDSTVPPAMPALVAEVAGELRAAISLVDGAVTANPFRPTADLVELLRARERQLQTRYRRKITARLFAAWRRRVPALG